MALIRTIVRVPLQASVNHTEVSCSYDVVMAEDGSKLLQLDTYGSKARQHPGKKSQSIRFSPEAIAAIKKIIAENGL